MFESRYLRTLGAHSLGALMLVFLLAGSACMGATAQVPRPIVRAVERAAMVRMDSTGIIRRTLVDLPRASRPVLSAVRGCDATGEPRIASDKLHPLLERWIEEGPPTRRVQLMVTFRDRHELPRFPEPNTREPRDSRGNLAALRAADSLIRRIESLRAKEYAGDSATLVREHQAQILQKYWIAQALLVNLPLGEVPALVHRKDVVYLAPNYSGEPPPDDAPPDDVPPAPVTSLSASGTPGVTCTRNDLPATARAYMNTNTYRAGEVAHGWMSLFDTGVRADHQAFNLASGVRPALSVLGDCLGDCDDPANCVGGVCVGPSDCVGGETGDIVADGHGTSAAAILVGLPNPDECHSGLTAAQLTSYRVYSTGCCPVGCSGVCLVRSAVLNAFQATTARLDRVIVAEMQAVGPPDCDISDAADQAFHAGAMVIAAQGNFDGCSSCATTPACIENCKVKSPANAHYAISAGAYDIKTLDPFYGSTPVVMSAACGPTPDGRIKPDVIAPTSSWVAGDKSTTDLHSFTATSGATPYVGGAAMLLHDFLLDTSPTYNDPGLTYAALILSGRDTWTLQSNGTAQTEFAPQRGAGPVVLPGNFTGWFGSTTLTTSLGSGVRIVVDTELTKSLEAAIWWADPKDASGTFHHCRVHLDIESWIYGVHEPEVFEMSNSPTSVFQRVTLNTIHPGDDEWFVMFNLMDDPFSHSLPGLTVYYAIAARR